MALEFKIDDPVIHRSLGRATVVTLDVGCQMGLPCRIRSISNGDELWARAENLKRDDSGCRQTTMNPTQNNPNKWRFNVRNHKGIDFSKIRDNLTYEKPIALVSAGKTHYVYVHPRLLVKADKLDICLPVAYVQPLDVLHAPSVTIETNPSQFTNWIEWASRVKQAPWGGKKPRKPGNLVVTVVLPGV